jgi:thiol-disulfide isomerase/thioredoxin
MSGLLFLGNDDFNISKGSNGPILCNTLSGFSLVLFYSTQCKYCNMLIPIFKKLPISISGCQFGMVNISIHKDLIKKSKNTILPITYVPLIILFVSGKPYMIYKGPQDENEIKRFIIEVYNKINNKQKFVNENNKQKLPVNRQHAVLGNLGIPLYGDSDMISYLEFSEDKCYFIPEKKDDAYFLKFTENKGYFK